MDETTSQDNENGDVQDISLEIQKETRETEKRRHNHSRKRKNNDDDDILQLLKNKILYESQETSGENDEYNASSHVCINPCDVSLNEAEKLFKR